MVKAARQQLNGFSVLPRKKENEMVSHEYINMN